MGKSVYSIVLDDDVIKMIDSLSAKQGTSRSNLINRILAQHISMPTAETIISDIYNSMESFLKGHSSLKVRLPPNGSLINMRSPLRYKYNPTVKYTVEIFERGEIIGQLKVSMRTQNETLINILDNFFVLWAELEFKYCNIKSDNFEISRGKLIRLLNYTDCNDYNYYGTAIANYIDLFDSCMKEFFNYYTTSPSLAIKNTQKFYVENLTEDVSKL